MSSFQAKLVTFVLIIAAICGCGSSGPGTATVTGIVRLDGQPLSSGTITFTPKGGRSATGFIQADGTFSLTTFSDGDGALPGKHTVTITPGAKGPTARPNFESDRPTMKSSSPLPARYGLSDTSGLEFEVQSGETNHAEFDLKS